MERLMERNIVQEDSNVRPAITAHLINREWVRRVKGKLHSITYLDLISRIFIQCLINSLIIWAVTKGATMCSLILYLNLGSR